MEHRDRHAPLGEPSFGFALDFMRVLWAVDHGLQSNSERMRRKYDVTGPQRMVIRIVGLRPGISAGSLSAILHLHPSTLTGVLKRLVERRLLTRATDAQDSRRSVLTLTQKGKGIDGLKEGTIEGKIQRALGTLRKREVATAAGVLRVVAEALDRE